MRFSYPCKRIRKIKMREDEYILIVDDDPNMCETLSDILSEDGYKATGVNSIGLAREKLKDKFYNIIFLDLKFPNGSGLDFLKEIKEINENIIVIVFTGFASLESAVTALNEGAFAYIQKPLNIEEVKATLKKGLKMQKLSFDNKDLLIGLEGKMREIENLYKLKSEFTSKVSHELRTPLAAIKEGIDLVWDETTGKINAEQREFLEIAKRNVDRLTHFINEVLDFSKLTSQKAKLKEEMGHINEIIESVINVNKPMIEKKGLYLKNELSATKDLVFNFDADIVYEILNNLINNAIKFTDKGGITICSSWDKTADSIKVCIEDTGIGIKKEDIPKLFQPFVQVGDRKRYKLKEDSGGTGLGLAICKEIIGQLGGKIWVESEFGKGSRFVFTMPIESKKAKI